MIAVPKISILFFDKFFMQIDVWKSRFRLPPQSFVSNFWGQFNTSRPRKWIGRSRQANKWAILPS